ncbi:pB438L [African swine fever virus]|uniref:PB438L n=1 Tax=African swine fever virus TaxID=10497 RepID=A0A8A1V5N6_ASF|nr:pB438L [African swine fever virus]
MQCWRYTCDAISCVVSPQGMVLFRAGYRYCGGVAIFTKGAVYFGISNSSRIFTYIFIVSTNCLLCGIKIFSLSVISFTIFTYTACVLGNTLIPRHQGINIFHILCLLRFVYKWAYRFYACYLCIVYRYVFQDLWLYTMFTKHRMYYITYLYHMSICGKFLVFSAVLRIFGRKRTKYGHARVRTGGFYVFLLYVRFVMWISYRNTSACNFFFYRRRYLVRYTQNIVHVLLRNISVILLARHLFAKLLLMLIGTLCSVFTKILVRKKFCVLAVPRTRNCTIFWVFYGRQCGRLGQTIFLCVLYARYLRKCFFFCTNNIALIYVFRMGCKSRTIFFTMFTKFIFWNGAVRLQILRIAVSNVFVLWVQHTRKVTYVTVLQSLFSLSRTIGVFIVYRRSSIFIAAVPGIYYIIRIPIMSRQIAFPKRWICPIFGYQLCSIFML